MLLPWLVVVVTVGGADTAEPVGDVDFLRVRCLAVILALSSAATDFVNADLAGSDNFELLPPPLALMLLLLLHSAVDAAAAATVAAAAAAAAAAAEWPLLRLPGDGDGDIGGVRW